VNKKKILIHSIVFSPDGASTAYLYNDIALKFSEAGYDVVVLTTTPHYNIVSEELAKQPLSLKWWGLYYKSSFHNISVIHVPQKKFKTLILRNLGFVYWHVVSLILGLLQKNVSLILSPSPPLTIGLVNIIIAKIKGAKVIYNVQEIYPDFLINQGTLKVNYLIKALKSLEHIIYNHSDAVTTIDDVFYKTIANRFKDPSKLHIIPNFVDTDLYRPLSSDQINLDDNLFAKKEGVLKVMYAGNVGYAQDWESLLQIAKLLKADKVEFFVIGEGVMKSYLEKEKQLHNLVNLHLIPYQPRDKMPQLVAYADLHFIFMTKQMEGLGFPSKVYTIMACEKPLLIVSGENTPIRNFLEPVHCAFIVNSSNFGNTCHHLVESIKKAVESPLLLKQMGKKGYDLIEKHYSNKAVTSQYVNLVNQVLNG
jgi:colanic acid biosynthesis glycosyl transferase WcaI